VGGVLFLSVVGTRVGWRFLLGPAGGGGVGVLVWVVGGGWVVLPVVADLVLPRA
jgi:hypothetical protein